MSTFIEWEDIDFKGRHSGEVRVVCPNCSQDRKKKNAKDLAVNLNKGLAFCHHCEAISVRDKQEQNTEYSKYTPPPKLKEEYLQYTDKFIEYTKDVRGISAKTMSELKVSQEEAYYPQLQKNRPSTVFNYYEGEELVNKKFRTPDKYWTQSQDGKSIMYNINSIIGKDTCYIVEGGI